MPLSQKDEEFRCETIAEELLKMDLLGRPSLVEYLAICASVFLADILVLFAKTQHENEGDSLNVTLCYQVRTVNWTKSRTLPLDPRELS